MLGVPQAWGKGQGESYTLFQTLPSHGANHGSTYRRYAYRYNAKKERGTSMEVFARNESHKGAMMNV